MRWVLFSLVAAWAVILWGCSYEAPTFSAPQPNVYSGFLNKVPGRWAMTIYVNGIDQTVHPTGFKCAANDYPLAVSSAFAQSAYGTFDTVIDNVEPIERPLGTTVLAKNGFDGIIRVKGDSLRARLSFSPSLVAGAVQADVELDASVEVDSRAGHVGSTHATGHGTATNDGGVFCEGGATALQLAAERAMRDVVGVLAERVAAMPMPRGAKVATK